MSGARMVGGVDSAAMGEDEARPGVVAGVWLSVAAVLSGLALFCWQIYVWLRTSQWMDLTVVTALKWFDVAWAKDPADWLGLYQTLEVLPIAFALVAFGMVSAWILLDDQVPPPHQ